MGVADSACAPEVNLVASSSHLATCRKTLKYFSEIFSENLAHVGLRPAGRITGRLDVHLTGSQAGGQIDQLGGSFEISRLSLVKLINYRLSLAS